MKKRRYLYLGILFVIFALKCLDGGIAENPDSLFLFNRAEQMYNCLKDGIYPYLYYDDFGGVGYGSSFFYGHLNLFPFLVFVPMGSDVFLKVFFLVELALNYLGVSYFAKKFIENNEEVAIVFCTSVLFNSTSLLANLFAVGLSWFFLGRCIDFFRDKKSFIPASILFVILLNSHMLTSVISFLVCCFIMIYYFNKSRLKDYVKFASATVLLCLYNICNVLYHIDALRLGDNYEFMSNFDTTYGCLLICCNTVLPFFGYILSGIFDEIPYTAGVGILNLTFSVYLCYLIFKNRSNISKKCKSVIVLCLIGFIIGVEPIWMWLNSVISIFIQFPTRYEYYMLVALIIIAFRFTKPKTICVLSIICLLDIVVYGGFIGFKGDFEELGVQILNGEYLSNNFIQDKELFDYMSSHAIGNNTELDYDIDKNKVIVHIPEHKDDMTVTVPKLYYRGYVTDKGFKCSSGYSNFVEVDVEDYSGDLEVYYRHPVFLVVLQALGTLGVVVLFWIHLFKYKYTIDFY